MPWLSEDVRTALLAYLSIVVVASLNEFLCIRSIGFGLEHASGRSDE